MTIISAAIKDNKISISADTQISFGSIQAGASYLKDHNKLYQVNDSVVGLTGWTATTQILEHLIHTEPDMFHLHSRWDIFEMLLALHEKLKDKYHIETTEDSDQPVESNQLDGLIINPKGIFQFDSYREVHQHTRFWALGSGQRLALGAMHALYSQHCSAQEIAEAGVLAAVEFDNCCHLPLTTFTLDLEP